MGKIMMNKPPLLFIAVVILIVVLATRQYWQKKRQDAENDRSPVRSLQVEVIDKREVLAPIVVHGSVKRLWQKKNAMKFIFNRCWAGWK